MQTESINFLKDIWYSAGPAADFKPGSMAHRTLLGEPILVGRDHGGEVFALRDICPHRGVLLSAGLLKSTGNGTAGSEVECPYHGWRFGTDGGCTAIPSLVPGQTMDVGRIKVRSYPVEERQGLIWIFMAETPHAGAPTLPAPIIPLVGEAARPLLVEAMTFHCNVDHAVIGLMDPAHGPFVHKAWWWRDSGTIHAKAKNFRPSPLGFTMSSHKPSSNSALYKVLGGEVKTEISFQLPGLRIEQIQVGAKRHIVGVTTVTPITADTTEVRQLFYWNIPWLALARPFLRSMALTFLDQDRSMVDLQAEGLKYDPRLMLIDDSDMQAKWYFQLKREWQNAQAEGRAFMHPIKEETVLRWRS